MLKCFKLDPKHSIYLFNTYISVSYIFFIVKLRFSKTTVTYQEIIRWTISSVNSRSIKQLTSLSRKKLASNSHNNNNDVEKTVFNRWKRKDNDVTKVTFLDAGVAGIFSLGTGPLGACERVSSARAQLAAATITGGNCVDFDLAACGVLGKSARTALLPVTANGEQVPLIFSPSTHQPVSYGGLSGRSLFSGLLGFFSQPGSRCVAFWLLVFPL